MAIDSTFDDCVAIAGRERIAYVIKLERGGADCAISDALADCAAARCPR
ncbi:hypothetical protein AB0F15_35500 [Amycolatopsis sp. NPDC026612]